VLAPVAEIELEPPGHIVAGLALAVIGSKPVTWTVTANVVVHPVAPVAVTV
jgi:hypothetical protein